MSIELVAKELRALQSNGLLRPAAVVAWAAANPGSALHASFEWSDTEAAQQWRLHQARELIIRVRVTFEGDKTQKIRTRRWVSLQQDRHEAGGYRELSTVLNDTQMRSQLLVEAKRELASFRRKYTTLTELAGVFRAIDSLGARESPVAAE